MESSPYGEQVENCRSNSVSAPAMEKATLGLHKAGGFVRVLILNCVPAQEMEQLHLHTPLRTRSLRVTL